PRWRDKFSALPDTFFPRWRDRPAPGARPQCCSARKPRHPYRHSAGRYPMLLCINAALPRSPAAPAESWLRLTALRPVIVSLIARALSLPLSWPRLAPASIRPASCKHRLRLNRCADRRGGVVGARVTAGWWPKRLSLVRRFSVLSRAATRAPSYRDSRATEFGTARSPRATGWTSLDNVPAPRAYLRGKVCSIGRRPSWLPPAPFGYNRGSSKPRPEQNGPGHSPARQPRLSPAGSAPPPHRIPATSPDLLHTAALLPD